MAMVLSQDWILNLVWEEKSCKAELHAGGWTGTSVRREFSQVENALSRPSIRPHVPQILLCLWHYPYPRLDCSFCEIFASSQLRLAILFRNSWSVVDNCYHSLPNIVLVSEATTNAVSPAVVAQRLCWAFAYRLNSPHTDSIDRQLDRPMVLQWTFVVFEDQRKPSYVVMLDTLQLPAEMMIGVKSYELVSFLADRLGLSSM